MLPKRIFDLCITIPGIIFLLPFFLIIAVFIKIDSPGPVFFRQVRVGQYGRNFRIFKFRTMVAEAESMGSQITVGNDFRVTGWGRFLRKYKLDELPQLFNIVKGEMSLVGPRPEVPRYVAEYPKDIKEVVLSIPPGITDFASIEFKDENEVLDSVVNSERVYIEQILPVKLGYYVRYARERTLWLDIKLIFKTFFAVFNLLPDPKRKAEQHVASASAMANGEKNISMDKKYFKHSS